jgi:hypothetical protein
MPVYWPTQTSEEGPTEVECLPLPVRLEPSSCRPRPRPRPSPPPVPVNPYADEYRQAGCCSDGPCSGPPPSWKCPSMAYSAGISGLANAGSTSRLLHLTPEALNDRQRAGRPRSRYSDTAPLRRQRVRPNRREGQHRIEVRPTSPPVPHRRRRVWVGAVEAHDRGRSCSSCRTSPRRRKAAPCAASCLRARARCVDMPVMPEASHGPSQRRAAELKGRPDVYLHPPLRARA